MGMVEAGAYIRRCREAAGLTQLNVGDELSVSDQIVSMWELGTSVPKGDNLMRLCDLIGADICEVQRLYLGREPEIATADPLKQLRAEFDDEASEEDRRLRDAAIEVLRALRERWQRQQMRL